MTWADPLYRRLDVLPGTGDPVVFAGVPVEVTVTDTDPASVDAQWMADRDVTLTVADGVGPDALARVLPEFLARAASLADRPTEATLTLPSRDVDRGRVARAAGLAPNSVLAVTDLRRPAGGGLLPAGVVVRDAAAGDIEVVAALWHEQAEYESRVGTLRVSEPIRAAIRAKAAECVEGATTVLVAERDGAAVGAVVADPPQSSAWAGIRLLPAPVSYLAMASTSAGARGSGIGAALVAELHRRHRVEGTAASTLHYGAVNPLSVPFWSQQGYRPLITFYAAVIS